LLDRGQVLALVPECGSGEVAQLTIQRGLFERLLVESHLRVLELQHQLQDSKIL
jgi:hypothetical protein